MMSYIILAVTLVTLMLIIVVSIIVITWSNVRCIIYNVTYNTYTYTTYNFSANYCSKNNYIARLICKMCNMM